MVGLFLSHSLKAQDGQNQLLYSNLAQQLVYTDNTGGASSTVLPSVALDNGLSSYIDNPASMALINMSYFSSGLLTNISQFQNTYLGQQNSFDNSNTLFGNIGLTYRVPTDRGSLVVGGGYTLTNQINRVNIVGGYNDESTITDVFKREGSSYYDIAFETYAIDWGDVDQTYLESIFRIGFDANSYPGIYQDAEVRQKGSLGEYSLFLATEFFRDFFFGVSAGVEYGNYKFSRDFLETDLDNQYNGDFIEADAQGNGGTDIYDISLQDEINMEIIGANIKPGILYRSLPFMNVGVSVKIPSKLTITEDYFSEIVTNFDDGRNPFYDNFESEFTYAIKRPFQWNFGVALDDINGFSMSWALEIIDYTATEIDLVSKESGNLDFNDIVALREQQDEFDRLIAEEYRTVYNVKMGAKYQTRTGYELRTGFAFLPGKSTTYEADRYVISGGLGFPLTREWYLDITTQYTGWEDRSVIYEYNDPASGDIRNESIEESINQFNVLVGFKYRF